MKRSTAVSLSILFALMLLTATVALLLRPRPVVLAAVPLMGAGAEVCTGTNLLTNPTLLDPSLHD